MLTKTQVLEASKTKTKSNMKTENSKIIYFILNLNKRL